MRFVTAPASATLAHFIGGAAVFGMPWLAGWALIQDIPGLNLAERYGIFGVFTVALFFSMTSAKKLADKWLGKLVSEMVELRTENKLLRTELIAARQADAAARQAAVDHIVSAVKIEMATALREVLAAAQRPGA